MKQVMILMILTALVLTGCTHPESKKSDAGRGIDSISGTDRALEEASEKSLTAEQQRETLDHPRSRQIASFVPDGYAILATAAGDLDSDGLADKLLVMKNKNERTLSSYADEKPAKRPLLLLLGQTDKSYRLAFRNDDAVYCIDCGGIDGDPFIGVTIKDGDFSITHGVAGNSHWERTSAFRYDKAKQNWLLYKDHYISFRRNTSDDPGGEAMVADVDKERTARDFGQVTFDAFDIYEQQ